MGAGRLSQAELRKAPSVDSASLHELVRLLGEQRLDDRKEWERASVAMVSALLVAAPYITVAPSPTRVHAIQGPFQRLDTGFRDLGVVKRVSPTVSNERSAFEELLRHPTPKGTTLADCLAELKTDPEFDHWVSSAPVGWPEHAIEHDGLFEKEFIPLIADALGVTQAEVIRLQKLSQRVDQLPALAEQRSPGTPGAMIADAYVIGALLRGRYHELVAKLSKWKLTRHPIRAQVGLPAVVSEPHAFKVTDTAAHLGALLVASAFVERRPSARMEVYLQNLERLRRRVRPDPEALREFSDAARMEQEVVHIADRAGITTRSRRAGDLLRAGLAAGFGTLTAIILLPWTEPAIAVPGGALGGFIGEVALGSVDVGARLETFDRQERLEALYRAGSGLLRPAWEPEEL